MPVEFQVLTDHRLLISKHIGAVSDEECVKAHLEAYQLEGVDVSFDQLIDLTSTESKERSPTTLRHIARMNKVMVENANASAKVAIVAPLELSYGLARMYEAFASDTPGECSVFRSTEDAMKWLGKDTDISNS